MKLHARICVVVAVALVTVGIGCESSNSTRSDQNSGYAGGDGMYGENPVQPGEHSKQRFDQDRDVPSGNLQGGQEVH